MTSHVVFSRNYDSEVIALLTNFRSATITVSGPINLHDLAARIKISYLIPDSMPNAPEGKAAISDFVRLVPHQAPLALISANHLNTTRTTPTHQYYFS